jgi:hypothetical protein
MLATDLDHLPLVPTRGWRARLDQAGTVTVEWPAHWPLLAGVPLELPDSWVRSATEHGIVLLFAGHGLGLHEHAGDGQGSHPTERLLQASENGALAAGVVPFTSADQHVADHG